MNYFYQCKLKNTIYCSFSVFEFFTNIFVDSPFLPVFTEIQNKVIDYDSCCSCSTFLQSKLILEKSGDNLDDEHMAKLIVYMINDFEKKKPYLLHKRNVGGKIAPKFQTELKNC